MGYVAVFVSSVDLLFTQYYVHTLTVMAVQQLSTAEFAIYDLSLVLGFLCFIFRN